MVRHQVTTGGDAWDTDRLHDLGCAASVLGSGEPSQARPVCRYRVTPWVVRLDTIVHELYHIAPDASGLRRLARADGSIDHRTHPPQFFDDVRDLVCSYLDTAPSADVLEVVRHDFATLQARHGSVVATTFRDGSYPQRYVDVLADQPVAPAVLVEPFKEAPGRALFTEADLVVRDFSRAPALVPVCAA